jgi:hypothetical protein
VVITTRSLVITSTLVGCLEKQKRLSSLDPPRFEYVYRWNVDLAVRARGLPAEFSGWYNHQRIEVRTRVGVLDQSKLRRAHNVLSS